MPVKTSEQKAQIEKLSRELAAAAMQGDAEEVKRLLAAGARDEKGHTPLLHAAAGGQDEAVRILLSHGADIHEKNTLGWNALMQAVFHNHPTTAELLLNAGAAVNEIDLEKGHSTLQLAGGNAQLVALLRRYGAQDRIIRERKPGEPYFLITDCDICTYLPHHRTELTHDYSPEDIPGLETIYHDHFSEYKAETTDMIKKCLHCGTYYHHYYFIDTEDPIGGIGADVDQNFWRIGLLSMHLSLQHLDKKEELAEIQARYPVIVEAFIALCKAKTKFMPYIRPYVAETLADYFTVKEDWDSIQKILLGHPEADLGRDVVKHIRLCSEMRLNESEPPTASDLAWAEIKTKYGRMLQAHASELKNFSAG